LAFRIKKRGEEMRVVATIEARMGSSRLHGKTLKEIAGKPMLGLLLERVKSCKTLNEIVVATTTDPEDIEIVKLADKMNVKSFRGSVDNVLDRVLNAARTYKADVIVELTGDCPLFDPEVIDRVVQTYLDNDYDYVSNNLKDKTWPAGTEAKVFSLNTLDEVNRLTTDKFDREHVSLYIYEHPERYRLFDVIAPPELRRPELRLTVDTKEDFELVESIYKALYKGGRIFTLKEIIQLLDKNEHLRGVNKEIKQKPVRY
jgi:spore coat polysaccharide biosynthesis protein SpsF